MEDTSVWQSLIDSGNSLLGGVLTYQNTQAANQVAVTEASTASLLAQAKVMAASQTYGIPNQLLLVVAAGLAGYLIYKKA